MVDMAINSGNSASTHFGRQMRKERLAHGWSLRDFQARTEIDISVASLIENGKRPPNERVAKACDAAWPERRGWFLEYYEDSKSWVPAGFRNWAEHEDKAATLRDWWPSIVSGLLQTEDYAREVLSVEVGVSDEVLAARLAARMARQQRVLFRPEPPSAWFVVDEMALYRYVGSPETMAAQMRHLADVAALPNVTLTVMGARLHPCNESGFILADNAAYAEHVAGGCVFIEPEKVTSLARRFDTLRAESYRASESLALLERMAGIWTTGVRAATVVARAEHASKSRRLRES
jgi:transcriptional regulator with XRE-family HTH domain